MYALNATSSSYPHYSYGYSPYLQQRRSLPSFALPQSVVPQSQQAIPVAMQKAAKNFYNATAGMVGLNMDSLKLLLKVVSEGKYQDAFDQAVRAEFLQHGKHVNGALDVLKNECLSNSFKKFFKQSQYNDLEDYLLHGRSLNRSTSAQYFLHGMWHSLENFISVCAKRPVLSAAVIGGVFVLGHVIPFLGGASGVAILGWSLAASAYHGYQASKIPGMTEQKATHLRDSGENLTAFLVTMLGYHGISESVAAGYKAMFEPIPKSVLSHASKLDSSWLNGVYRALNNKSHALGRAVTNFRSSRVGHVLFKQPPVPAGERTWTHELKQFLFISGILDNVLLPFNAVTEYIQKRQATLNN